MHIEEVLTMSAVFEARGIFIDTLATTIAAAKTVSSFDEHSHTVADEDACQVY